MAKADNISLMLFKTLTSSLSPQLKQSPFKNFLQCRCVVIVFDADFKKCNLFFSIELLRLPMITRVSMWYSLALKMLLPFLYQRNCVFCSINFYFCEDFINGIEGLFKHWIHWDRSSKITRSV